MSWATHGRTSSNSNDRGNSATRRARKQWLLDTFGDGKTAPCSFEGCETIVDFTTITVDRYPIPHVDGGTYRRGNIRPACHPCNFRHGLELARRAREAIRARAKEEALAS